jgi:RNA recognition motif-containing protein
MCLLITEKDKRMNIYVGNISYRMGDSDLEEVFAQFGEVKSAKIITDRETGRSKGFGFIEMEANEDGNKAIEALNGNECEGRTLRVNEARPREERPRRQY